MKEYRLYDDGAACRVSRTLVLNGGAGLGGFSFEKEWASALARYGKLLPDGVCVAFDLPAKLGPELDDLAAPVYDFRVQFAEDSNHTEPTLATNSKADPYPRPIADSAPVTDAAMQALESLLAENGLANMEPNFAGGLRGDIDGDSMDESVFIASTKFDENGYPMIIGRSPDVKGEIGTYSVVLLEDGDTGIQVVYSDLRPYSGEAVPYVPGEEQTPVSIFQYIQLVDAADLNGDGRYEIGVKQGLWEAGYYFVFAAGPDGRYELVMQSDYGM